MRSALKQLGVMVLLAASATAQSVPGVLREIKAVPSGNTVQIELALTSAVKPTVSVTSDPARLILDFPGITTGTAQQHVSVNANGVRQIRYALYKSDPPTTRVVVDLDRSYPYDVQANGTHVTLSVQGSATARATKRQIPAAATSGGFFDVFRRRGPSSPEYRTENEDLNRPIPGTVPSASRPNVGSLQQGTVYPGMGNPGTGNVPTGNAGTTSPAPATTAASPAPAPVSQPSVTVLASTPPASPTPSAHPATPPPVTKLDSPAPIAEAKIETSPKVAEPVSPAPMIAAHDSTAPAKVETTESNENTQATVTAPAIPPVSETKTDSTKPTPAVPSSESPSPEVKNDQVAISSPPQNPSEERPSQQSEQKNENTGMAEPTPAAAPPAATEEANVAPGPAMPALDPNLKTVFKVKYVAEGVAYLDGGSSSGLVEGMKLEIKDTDLEMKQGSTADPSDPRVVAELVVSGLADTSAVTDIHAPKRPVKVGDLAYLSSGDAQALVQQRALSSTRKYPIAVTFTEDDPQDEEARAEVPRPPQPSVNRARGWIGLDHMGTITHGASAMKSDDLGMVLRADFTRIGGSYWNLTGYWRGRLSSRSSTNQPTLQDLINRTYHLGLTYENPNSRFVAGVGRLYLPWAPSLNTIDGGYFGMRLSHGATAGLFAGSTPDPTSWNYNPDQHIGGAFINFQGGSYDNFFYTSTSGIGASLLKWQMDRPFVFFENTLAYKRYLSIYDSLQADSPRGNPAVPAPGAGLSRNFLTVRMQVHPRLELDFNHNYFRDIPTFDPTLIGTGLLDKYLFQGFSFGARAEIIKQVFLYGDAGRSNRSGDTKNSWNQMVGISFNHLPWFGLRADAHYSRFYSSFGDGSYEAVSVSRDITDSLRLSVLGGTQNYSSTLASNNRTQFVNSNVEWSFGTHYFTQGGLTINRGGSLSYDQWLFTMGYRFDSKARHK